ncbi:MAG: RNA-splicing ligase RtcB, partial [Candidatus Tagabacteria bacterium CG09_land_8_20_14_0_10_41_14]
MLRRKIMFGRESLKKITDYLWEIPKTGQMRVAARFYASEKMMKDILQDRSLEQL